MLPGYTLFALTAVGDPEALDAFDALHRYAGPTGQYPEALLYEDVSALQVVYDPTGGIGDVAVRFRPWEGGIDMDAMLVWLVGAEPTADGARLRPHLPATHEHLGAAHLAAGLCAGSLSVTGDEETRLVEFTSEALRPCTLEVGVPLPEDREPRFGEAVALPGGERVVPFEPLELEPGETASFAVELRSAAR